MEQITKLPKVGVITLPGDFNYGNKLQLYAVMSIWRSLGYDPLFLSHKRAVSKYGHPLRSIRKMLGKESVSGEDLRTLERAAAFNRFNEYIPTEEVVCIDDVNPSDFVYFSVGSDQVWNPPSEPAGTYDAPLRRTWQRIVNRSEIEDWISWYFLDFANRSQRIAMAPSVCISSLSERQISLLARGVSNFDTISVRETFGADLIYKCSGRKATVICDPTLVLNRKEWCSVMDDRLTPNNTYVLAYILGTECKESKEVIELVSDGGKIPVIYLSDRSKMNELDAGPAEFLSLIANARHVVTDSYHASVFSCIFERPLTILQRYGSASMFSRMDSLADELGIRDRIYDSSYFNQEKLSDYELVHEAIEKKQEEFISYIKRCLSST